MIPQKPDGVKMFMSLGFSLCGRAPWRRPSTVGISILGGATAWAAGLSARRVGWVFMTSIGEGFWVPRYACSAKPAAKQIKTKTELFVSPLRKTCRLWRWFQSCFCMFNPKSCYIIFSNHQCCFASLKRKKNTQILQKSVIIFFWEKYGRDDNFYLLIIFTHFTMPGEFQKLKANIVTQQVKLVNSAMDFEFKVCNCVTQNAVIKNTKHFIGALNVSVQF